MKSGLRQFYKPNTHPDSKQVVKQVASQAQLGCNTCGAAPVAIEISVAPALGDRQPATHQCQWYGRSGRVKALLVSSRTVLTWLNIFLAIGGSLKFFDSVDCSSGNFSVLLLHCPVVYGVLVCRKTPGARLARGQAPRGSPTGRGSGGTAGSSTVSPHTPGRASWTFAALASRAAHLLGQGPCLVNYFLVTQLMIEDINFQNKIRFYFIYKEIFLFRL